MLMKTMLMKTMVSRYIALPLNLNKNTLSLFDAKLI